MNEITVALEEQRNDLIEHAKTLGFECKFSTDVSRWITLYKSDAPPRMRYQFEESAEGLDQLGQFLQEHGNWSTTATNKAGDPIGITVDREQRQFYVTWPGLAGYDSVDLFLGSEHEAQTLYNALLAVEEVEVD